MRRADPSDSSENMGTAATNGRHSAVRKSPAKLSADVEETGGVGAPAPLAAPIACAEPTPVDVPMWPLQSAAWLQPDVPPSPPAWSGLAVERRHRIPAPDFLLFHTAPLNRRDGPNGPGRAFTEAAPILPHGDLAPLGWDPRAVRQKESPITQRVTTKKEKSQGVRPPDQPLPYGRGSDSKEKGE